MPDSTNTLPWSQPGWLAQASAWICAELDRHGISASGPIEQPHLRPWSTVLRVPTSVGDLYFKATSPLLAHEPALTHWLARRRPDCVAGVLAVDTQHGWMLMPDGGTTLRSVIQADRDIRHWHAVLPIYAQLQSDLAPQLDTLLELGCLDYRLAGLPARYAALLEDTQALRIDLPDGLTDGEYARLRALAPRFEELCERLAGYGIPETLHHDDFHDGNIFFGGAGFRFFDWGESCIAHPFYTLVVGLRGIAYRFDLAEEAPELDRLRQLYLEPWAAYGSRASLLEACRLAKQIGSFCRALTWHRVVSSLEVPFREQEQDAVPGWLQIFLETVIA
ncbi:MAG TPA: phosphotransferase [Roseiflexaceae bacterium]|nr:phosphotransferase [Roseiflexaceae bacterium]